MTGQWFEDCWVFSAAVSGDSRFPLMLWSSQSVRVCGALWWMKLTQGEWACLPSFPFTAGTGVRP